MSEKNLIWLTLDSIRADRTSVGGSGRDTTPTLARIGSRSDGFAGICFSHAIWSQPSVASIMTGTYPSTHGSGSFNETLPEGIPTVAERLAAVGYRTVGVSSNPYFSPMTGTDRGFDKFDFASGVELAREAGLRSLLSFARHLRMFSGGFQLEKRKHDANFLLNEIVKDRLRSLAGRDEPFFLAAHYPGAHHPYYPSPAFRSTFADSLRTSPARAAELAFDHTTDIYARVAEGRIEDEEAADALGVMYDATVAQVDALISRLLGHVDQLGLGEDTIVVVTSDHGDLLGELGLFSHKLVLHDALIGVPLAVQGSKTLANTDSRLVQHADVMETLLAELGADTTGMQGTRLDRSVRQEVVAQRGAETYRKTVEEVRKHDGAFSHDHVLPGFVTALRTGEWKYVAGDGDEILYRLPAEDEDVSGEFPGTVKQFRTRLEEWMDDHGEPVTSNSQLEFDEEVEDLLADLGYLVD